MNYKDRNWLRYEFTERAQRLYLLSGDQGISLSLVLSLTSLSIEELS